VRRKLAWAALALLAIAAIGVFGVAPGVVDRQMNQVDGKPLPEVSAEAKALHASLEIVDLHADSLRWRRDLVERHGFGHLDLPRMLDGNLTLQVFSSVTKSPAGLNYDRNSAETRDDITLVAITELWPLRSWGSLTERSLYHAARLDRAVARSENRLIKVTGVNDIDSLLATHEGRVGAMLSIEGLHDLEGKAANLDRLYAAGFRMAGLTHFFDNELAGSMHGEEKGGLTPFGREIVRAMEAKGMIVDIAHCSHRCVADVLAMARRPVVSSHGGAQATCNVNRNLTDAEIRGVARTGGIVGIGYWDGAVCGTSPRAIARAMKHVRDLVGIEHVALGSDFDGSVVTRFDASQLVQVTQALMDEGFTPGEIRAAMGGNALRVLRAGIVPR
jgi:microsomal dipeptidase-like Zn-dependent dipeptidase